MKRTAIKPKTAEVKVVPVQRPNLATRA
jgi:hypothetical protein